MKSIRRLRIQHSKLEQVHIRLRERDKTLFKACTFALGRKNTARATMCANELAEVRKLISLLFQTQIAIERIILRLETIKELSNIMIDLKPALSALRNVTSNLVTVMPDVASELDRVNSSIQETLSVTKFSSEPPTILRQAETPGGQAILEEVNTVLEQKLTEQLPEPPASVNTVESKQPSQQIKEMVALVAACPDSYTQKEGETSEAFLSIKDLKMQSISLRVQRSEAIEGQLLDYIKRRKGQVDVTDCASKLKIPPNEVEKVLKNLNVKGKIVIQ